jgi:hypothetical protein
MLLAISGKKPAKEDAAKKTTLSRSGSIELLRSRDEVRGVSREVGFV